MEGTNLNKDFNGAKPLEKGTFVSSTKLVDKEKFSKTDFDTRAAQYIKDNSKEIGRG